MIKDKDFKKMIKEIQDKIYEQDERDFSKAVIEEYRNPINFGVLKNPDAFGELKGSCGDTMKFSLEIKDGKVIKGFFWTDGCGPSIACGNKLIKMILGKTLEDITLITSDDLDAALMGLPNENKHCAVLAVNALNKAIKNYKKITKN